LKVLLFMRLLLLCVVSLYLVACSTTENRVPTLIVSTDNNDSAPTSQQNVNSIPEVQPKPVKRTRAGNKSPYTVLGQTYTLLAESKGYQERGNASWYGTKFHGRRTANGEVYDMWAMTAAHKTLPIPSYVRVTNIENGRSLIVLVNDRGPFHSDRIIDLSYGAAVKLGFAEKGVTKVDVIDVTPVAAQPVISQSAGNVVAPAVSVPSKKPPKATSTSASTSHAGYFQVAAFQQLKKANKLKAKLTGLLSSPVYVVPNQDNTWYRVRVGPIANTQMMSEARQILSEQGIKKPQLIKAQ
jgi:rare lipoprotein A